MSGENEEVKPWVCPRGHILGVVKRNSSKIQELMLYRTALAKDQAHMPDVDVLAVVQWTTVVTCSVCGSKRTWYPGEDAINAVVGTVLEWRKTYRNPPQKTDETKSETILVSSGSVRSIGIDVDMEQLGGNSNRKIEALRQRIGRGGRITSDESIIKPNRNEV